VPKYLFRQVRRRTFHPANQIRDHHRRPKAKQDVHMIRYTADCDNAAPELRCVVLHGTVQPLPDLGGD
jgi:hypothetical protein